MTNGHAHLSVHQKLNPVSSVRSCYVTPYVPLFKGKHSEL